MNGEMCKDECACQMEPKQSNDFTKEIVKYIKIERGDGPV